MELASFPTMASLLLLYMFVTSVIPSTVPSPPTENSPYSLDPLNDTSHGRILSKEWIVLRLDCPGCPVYNPNWDTNATALVSDHLSVFAVSSADINNQMYDFQIDPYYSHPSHHNDPPSPAILLNNFTFYPPGPSLGWTGLTAHKTQPVPWTTTINDYLTRPSRYDEADLVGSIEALKVPNTHGWNLTCIVLFTVAYGTTPDNTFEARWSNISAIEVFLQRKNVSDSEDGQKRLELRDMEGSREEWTLEWYQIVPMKAVFDGGGIVGNGTSATAVLPAGLRDKLLGHDSGVPHEGTVGKWRIELWSGIQIFLLVVSLMVVIWSVANVATVVGAALLGSRQNETIDRQLA